MTPSSLNSTSSRLTSISRVDKYTNTDLNDLSDDSRIIYPSCMKNTEVQTMNEDRNQVKKSNARLELVAKKSTSKCKFDLEYLLKCYLMNEFRKNDLSQLREKLFQLMVLVDSSNPSLQADNRRFLTNLNNGCLIKSLNRNMLTNRFDDKEVSLVWLHDFMLFFFVIYCLKLIYNWI